MLPLRNAAAATPVARPKAIEVMLAIGLSAVLPSTTPSTATAQVTASSSRLPPRPPAALLPVPAEVRYGDGRLAVDETFAIGLSGHVEPRLERAAARLVGRLAAATGMPLRIARREPGRATLRLDVGGPGEAVQSYRENESYRLTVTPESAVLTAATTVGALRGLATFEQLVIAGSDGFGAREVTIEDSPRFPWRGLLIDVCRHWQPMDVILRNLDGMAAVKLNVLHWHLTEDQGFRIESRRYPRLHGMGSEGRYFTQEQIRQVVTYARDRGIRVVPEFDVPGHTTSWLVGHPELAGKTEPFVLERRWGVHDAALDPTREETYKVLDRFLEEMAELFPDEYIHIGGDEVTGRMWRRDPRIAAFMAERGMADPEDLQAYFNGRVSAILQRHGKKMAGWEETLHPDLPTDSLVQSWYGAESLAAAVKAGHPAILSRGYYLDHMRTAAFHYSQDPLAGAEILGTAEQERILGGEACMWGEFVTPETIDSRLWPRLAAIAERFWSPADVTDTADLYRRLERTSRQLHRLGLEHRANYLPMLERLAGPYPLEPLRVLADVVEPVEFYARPRSREYTTTTPLNRLVDAARPESALARRFTVDVDEVLHDPRRDSDARQRMIDDLVRWRDNDRVLQPALEGSFLLAEIAPLSRDLAAAATIGLEALESLAQGQVAEHGSVEARLEILDEIARPRAELDLVIVEPIRRLVRAAGNIE